MWHMRGSALRTFMRLTSTLASAIFCRPALTAAAIARISPSFLLYSDLRGGTSIQDSITQHARCQAPLTRQGTCSTCRLPEAVINNARRMLNHNCALVDTKSP